MKTPFVFGRIASEQEFTDRQVETQHLVNNFNGLVNTILISPRRWGKSSLVNKAARLYLEQSSQDVVVTIIKQALEKKELIDVLPDKINIQDPVFKHCLLSQC